MWPVDLVAEPNSTISPVENFTLTELFLKKTTLVHTFGIAVVLIDIWCYPKIEINWLFYQVQRHPVYHMHGELQWNLLLLISILLFPWNLHDYSCKVWTDVFTLWEETYTWSLGSKRHSRIAHQTCYKWTAVNRFFLEEYQNSSEIPRHEKCIGSVLFLGLCCIY